MEDIPMANSNRWVCLPRTAMWLAIALCTGATIGALGAATPVAAQGAWCAQYSGSHGGATNCGFYTLEQCRMAVSGVGGFCSPSPYALYSEPAVPRRLRGRYQ
jgi:hypothetical protein